MSIPLPVLQFPHCQAQGSGPALGWACAILSGDMGGAVLEGVSLEGTLLIPPSLHTSLPQPPSAELFHYDSTNAVNWGMRGNVLQCWGWKRGGPHGYGAPGSCPAHCRQLQKMGSGPEGGDGEEGGCLCSSKGGCLQQRGRWLMSLPSFSVPTEYKVRWPCSRE